MIISIASQHTTHACADGQEAKTSSQVQNTYAYKQKSS